MAFPTVAGNTGGVNPSSGTSFDVPLPSSISAGNLLIAFLSGGNPRTINVPTGWTSLFAVSGTESQLDGIYKIADGTEGGAVNVTTSTACFLAGNTFRITSFAGTPESATQSNGNTDTHGIPTFTVSWGVKQTLWIAAVGNRQLETVTTWNTIPYNPPETNHLRNAGGADGDAGGVSTAYINDASASQSGYFYQITTGTTPGCTASVAVRGGQAGQLISFD